MATATNSSYLLKAYNSAKDSENKMHDDAVARQFGFTGGLVGGMDIFAYMAHLPIERWGMAFLERGQMSGRFLAPVYDGEDVVATAEEGADGELALLVDRDGVVCATGVARLPTARPSVSLEDYVAVRPPPREARPAARAESFPVGSTLGIDPYRFTPEAQARYLADIHESESPCAREGIIHPSRLLRLGNWALMHNVVLGPWIHLGGTVTQLAPARVGDYLTVRGRVIANYERKGRRFLELDALIVANEVAPVAHLLHTAIYLQ